jgi:hypothetical protein
MAYLIIRVLNQALLQAPTRANFIFSYFRSSASVKSLFSALKRTNTCLRSSQSQLILPELALTFTSRVKIRQKVSHYYLKHKHGYMCVRFVDFFFYSIYHFEFARRPSQSTARDAIFVSGAMSPIGM